MAISLFTACSKGDGDVGDTFHYTNYSNATSDQSKTVQRWAKEVEELTDGAVSVNVVFA